MQSRADTDGVRIAELMATLSYAADLGLGQPMAHCLRQTVIALRMADMLGATSGDREATFYTGLMMNTHCHADAAEQAGWFGDDISFKGDGIQTLDMNTAQMLTFLMRRVGSHGAALQRAKRLATFPVTGHKRVVEFITTHSTLCAQFAERIGLDRATCAAIGHTYEQWDGKGYPQHLRGEDISLAARLTALAGPVEVFSRRSVEAARRVVRRHRGTQFDPLLADLFCDRAAELLDGLDQAADWDTLLDAQPAAVPTDQRPGTGSCPGGDGRPGRSQIALSGRALPGCGEPGRGGRAAVGHVRAGGDHAASGRADS